MSVIGIVGAGLVAAVLSVILKQYKPEFSIYISLGAGVIIFLVILSVLNPVLECISELTKSVNLDAEYGGILLKSLAVCYICQLACDCCKDAGEEAIARKIELSGRIAVTLLALPLFESLVKTVTGLISG